MSKQDPNKDVAGRTVVRRCRKVAVIGGGVSGAVAARALTGQKYRVLVLDKGRGAGGRCSTRRNEVMQVDHGAQYFTVADPRFREAVDAWSRKGVAARWDGRFVEIEDGRTTRDHPHDRWVGTPSMSRIVSSLLQDVDVKYNARVDGLKKESDGWRLSIDTGATFGPFDDVILAMPAPQAGELLVGVSPLLVDAAKSVTMTPCWAAMVAFDGPVSVEFDGAKLRGHDALAWVGCDTSKPGRPQGSDETWVLHADAGWSSEHVEMSREQAGPILLDAFIQLCHIQGLRVPKVRQVRAHRWRYARACTPLGIGCLTDPERTVTLCGDWLLGAKVEAAYLSGLAAAEKIL